MAPRQTQGRRFQTGQAIVLIALLMILLLGFLALAIDGARYYQTRRVTQNAADSAALAGIYYFSRQSSPTILGTWNSIVASITSNGILSANGISDAMTVLPNGQKPVQSWWVDSSGHVIGEFNRDTSGTIPITARAIKVTTHIRYRTFFGGVTGQLYLPAEATAIAQETIAAKMPVDFPFSVYIAGVNCHDATHWAAAAFNSQNIAFGGNVWINGTLAWDFRNQNADMLAHNWVVDGQVLIDPDQNDGAENIQAWAGNTAYNTNYAGGAQPGDNSNPNIMSTSANNLPSWNNFGSWAAPNNNNLNGLAAPTSWPYLAQPYPDQWPSWLYEDHYVSSFTHNPLTAVDFKKPTGALYQAYVNYDWQHYNSSANAYQYGYTPDQWFHIVTLTSADPHQNWLTFKQAYDNAAPTKDGIYYIEGGDISLDGSMASGTHVTLASTGRIYVPATNNNFYWTDAGFTAAGISIMTDVTAGDGCAENPYSWSLIFNGNHPQVTGYLYVPNGQFEMNANFDLGNHAGLSAAVLAGSWRNGTQLPLAADVFGSYSTQPQNLQYTNNPQPVALAVTELVNASP